MVKWVPGQDYQLASASYDDTVKLWDYEDDEYFAKQTLSDHTSTVWCICFSKDAKYLISSSEDKSIKVYSRTSSETYVFALNITGHHERVIYSVDYNSEHRLIISVASFDPTGWRR
jgi:WD40 repeat protein